MPPYMMTHPFSSDRVEALRQRVERGLATSTRRTAKTTFAASSSCRPSSIGFIQHARPDAGALSADATPRSRRAMRARSRIIASPSWRARAQRARKPDRREPEQSVLPGIDGPDPVRERRARRNRSPITSRSVELAPGQPLLLINLARALTAARGRAGADRSGHAAASSRRPRARQRLRLARTRRGARPARRTGAGRTRFGGAEFRRSAIIRAALEFRRTRASRAAAQHALLPARQRHRHLRRQRDARARRERERRGGASAELSLPRSGKAAMSCAHRSEEPLMARCSAVLCLLCARAARGRVGAELQRAGASGNPRHRARLSRAQSRRAARSARRARQSASATSAGSACASRSARFLHRPGGRADRDRRILRLSLPAIATPRSNGSTTSRARAATSASCSRSCRSSRDASMEAARAADRGDAAGPLLAVSPRADGVPRRSHFRAASTARAPSRHRRRRACAAPWTIRRSPRCCKTTAPIAIEMQQHRHAALHDQRRNGVGLQPPRSWTTRFREATRNVRNAQRAER